VTISDLLTRIVGILKDADVPYMITGSLAAAHYAPPRSTQDIDVVVDATLEGVDGVVDRLEAAGLYVSREAAHQAYERRGQFNAIDPERGWKVDLILRKERPFSVTEFSRRRAVSLMGVEVSVATIEDLILAKLEWMALGEPDLQRRDIVRLLVESRDSIDRDYMTEWVGKLGVRRQWEDALSRTSPQDRD
jgi:hypothetical protein